MQQYTNEHRIIFVGIHNKPGFEPLDSRTASGKLIDKVSEQLECKNVVRTNLYNANNIPKNIKLIITYHLDWFALYKPTDKDVIILLGREAAKYSLYWHSFLHVEYRHPSPLGRKESDGDYIKNLSQKINALCNTQMNS